MPGVIENHSIAQWSRLFAVLENLKGKLDKLDDQLQTVREQQSLMMGRLEDIEESLAWEDDGEDDDEEDDSFIDDGSSDGEDEDAEMSESASAESTSGTI